MSASRSSRGLRRVPCLRLLAVCRWGLLLAFAVPLPAPADALLLSDGSSVEGEIKDKGTEWEVVTDHGSLWVDKDKVRRRLGPFDPIIAQAEKDQQRARVLFEEAKKIEEREAHNAKLREAVKTLESARDALADAQEVYTSIACYSKISPFFRIIIQELRLYRDQFRVEGRTPAVPPSGEAKPPAVAPVPAPVPAAAAGNADAELAPLIQEVKALLEKGSLDEAYAKYQKVVREGGEAASLRPDLAKAYFDRAMKQKPPVLTDLRRAFDLDSGAVSYYEVYMQACYDKGVESASQKLWNDATKEFTQALRAASEMIAKADKARYHNVRGMAYQWRGIAETQKFKGKGGHMQIRTDWRQAKLDYEAALKMDPNGPDAGTTRDNLAFVNKVLSQLR